MTATNHAITAANISLAFQKWWILPVVFVSHFVLDLLPHYGEEPGNRGRRFITIQAIDATMLLAFYWLALSNSANNNLLIGLAIIVAISPDIIWVYRFVYEQRGHINMPVSSFSKLHTKFNWLERPNGWILEIIWFIAMFCVFIKLLPL